MKLDYETATSVDFTVLVADMGKPQRTSEVSATVHIDITDINDCPPMFTQDRYNVTVLLPTYDNIIIGQVDYILAFSYKNFLYLSVYFL